MAVNNVQIIYRYVCNVVFSLPVMRVQTKLRSNQAHLKSSVLYLGASGL
jgi:hypothetical protein